MCVPIVAAFFASLVFITSACYSARLGYVHDYWLADTNMFSNAQLAEASRDKILADAHRDAAKMWLSVSQNYQEVAVYLSDLTAYLSISTFLMLGSLLSLAFLPTANPLWVILLAIALLLVIVAGLFVCIYWRRGKHIPDRAVPLPFQISRIIPPLNPLHIKERWVKPQEMIVNYSWLGDHLKEDNWRKWLWKE